MRRAGRLALAIGLALAQRAGAENAVQAVLVGANEVPGPGVDEASFVAVVVVEGTKVTLTLTPNGTSGWMSAHIHRGAAGVAGKLVAEFPWSSGDGWPRRFAVSVSGKVAAGLVANPEKYYVDVHTPAFPGGAARGQLAARPDSGTSPDIASDRVVPLPPNPRAFQAAGPPLPPGVGSIALPRTGIAQPGPGVGPAAARDDWREPKYAGDQFADARGAPEPPPNSPRREQHIGKRILIEKADQKIAGAVPPRKTYLDPDFPVGLYATSGLDIVFDVEGDCTVVGSTVHITGAGSCSLTAHQPGDSNYLAAPIVDARFTIDRANQTLEFAEISSGVVYGPIELTLFASASSGLPVSFTASGPCEAVGPTLRVFDSGMCSVTASQGGDRNFNSAPSVTRTVQVYVPPPPPPEPPPG